MVADLVAIHLANFEKSGAELIMGTGRFVDSSPPDNATVGTACARFLQGGNLVKLRLLMLVVPFFVACSPVNPPQSPTAEARDSFRFFGGGTATTARIVEPDLLWSSVGSVQTFKDGYRGRWKEEIVDLRTRENLIEGTIGSFRTELHITPSADGFRIDGSYRGGLGQLQVTASAITGTVGSSWISVERKETTGIEYVSRSTGLAGELRTLHLPAQFGSLPRERQALYLALVIGS